MPRKGSKTDLKKGFKECPACAEWIREKAKICRFCGAVLTDEALPQFVPVEKRDLDIELNAGVERKFAEMGVDLSDPQRRRIVEFLKQSEDQYRSATVMFTDLTGYTRLCQQLKPEYVKEILDVYYKFFVQTVEFYNGFIVEFLGDGGLAVFGAPMAFERDAEAAVRAALDIRGRIRSLPAFQGIKVHISAGLATGEILSSVIRTKSPPHYKIYGHAVNLAARVEAAAEPDTVLIDPTTHELVKGVFDFTNIPPRHFKNVKEALPTYVVVSEKTKGAARRDFAVPFVGREQEKKQLENIWSAFVKELEQEPSLTPTPHGVILVGEAGIGKTRLALEFVGQRREQTRLLHVESAPYEAKVPWGVWRTVLASLWEGRPGEFPEKVRPKLERSLAKLGFKENDQNTFKLLFGLPEAVEALGSLSPALLQRLVCADLRLLLERLAGRRPLVLLFDDLQWADPTSLEMLASLLSEHTPRNVFFFLLHRSEFTLPHDGGKQFPCIRLEGLDEAARNALFNLLTDVREFLPEIRNFLLQQEEGNPFYLLEMIRTVKAKQEELKGKVAEKLLPKELARWVPPSLKEMLQARIDMLEKQRKTVLQCAAVLGRRFALQIIELFDHIREGLLSHLYALKTLEFLDDLPLPEGLEFMFRHNMTREVTYQSLIERQRQQLHQTVGERIEEQFRQRLTELYPLLAYHFSMSDDDRRAIHYLQLAGDQAVSVAATTEALEHYEQALTRLRRQKPTRDTLLQTAVILRSKGRLHRLAGEQKHAMDSFCSARELVRKCKAPREMAVLRSEIGLTFLQTSDYEQAETELSAGLRFAQRTKDRAIEGMTLNGLGVCFWGLGNFKKAHAYFSKAAGLKSDRRNPNLAADTRNNLALLEWKAGKLKEALQSFQKALQLRKKVGDKFGIAVTLMNLAIIEENLGRYPAAEKHYGESLQMAERIRYAQAMTAVHANLANLFLAQQRFAEALEHSAKSLELAQGSEDRRSMAIALENLALSHIGLKQFAEARQRLSEGGKIARGIGDAERQLSLDLVAIELQLTQSKPQRLKARLAHAEKALEEGGFDAERPRLLRLKAWAHFSSGKVKEARAVAEQALAEARTQNNRPEATRITKLQMLLKASKP